MLSRVAENVYWMARYLERVEDTSRLVMATHNTMLDMTPVSRVQPMNWEQLLAITGSREIFFKRNSRPDEHQIINFLIRDEEYHGSILNALHFARENLRTTRELFPRKAWEFLNRLFLDTRTACGHDFHAANRLEFLENVINECLKITGLLDSSMLRDEIFRMFRLGRYLERADMVTRILDVRGALMLAQKDVVDRPLRNALWLTVLKSLSGDQMYRRRVRPRIRGVDVLAFLLKDNAFPRAFRYGIEGVAGCLGFLGGAEAVQGIISRIETQLYLADITRLAENEGLHEFLDGLQILLGELHMTISATYFNQEIKKDAPPSGENSAGSTVGFSSNGSTSTSTLNRCSRPPVTTPFTGGTSA
ncbi:MAG: Alpha-E protein [Magnetococcales bacterium]|nr:Alpha-E protein [Magnetococcales bacterium]